ncbi:MAG: ImmA/IrrE family metallo-endopeptidase [Rickettsiales bacterium]
MNVDYLDDAFIKKRADLITKGYNKTPKIDIEGIATLKLGLKIHLVDLQSVYGKGTLGMIMPEEKLILCDKSLEPYGHNKETKEHILRFTIAHETGHYVLHRKYMENIESPIFHKNLEKHENKRLEIQANMLGAELLMPEYEFRKAYRHIKDEVKNITRYELKKNLSALFNVSMQAVGYKMNSLKL